MNKKKLLALLVSSAFLFAACGDDDSPSSPKNTDPEKELSSSSVEEDDCEDDECDEKSSSSSKKSNAKSSSSKKGDNNKDDESSSSTDDDDSSSSSSKGKNGKSSSSSTEEEPESSSSSKDADDSKKARAAKLTDLEKNVELKLFDQTVYLSTGSKQGLVALRIPDELWVVTYTDFENGQVQFADNNVGAQYSSTDAAKKIMDGLKDGIVLSFIVDKDGVVKYAVNDSKEYSEAVKAGVAFQKGKLSNAEDLKDKIYECTDGDTTRTFTFFDNSYFIDNYADGKLSYWTAGHYDIQRSTLLMRTSYSSEQSYSSMYLYSVGTDNSFTSTNGEAMNCKVKTSEYAYEKASDFVGEWQASNDGLDWEFTLKADGTFELRAYEGTKNVEGKSGFWDIYGYHMILRNQKCFDLKKCTNIHGQLQSGTTDKETGKISGFSFIHSGPDTPKIPTAFEAPEYE